MVRGSDFPSLKVWMVPTVPLGVIFLDRSDIRPKGQIRSSPATGICADAKYRIRSANPRFPEEAYEFLHKNVLRIRPAHQRKAVELVCGKRRWFVMVDW